jgi:hypothetical protein
MVNGIYATVKQSELRDVCRVELNRCVCSKIQRGLRERRNTINNKRRKRKGGKEKTRPKRMLRRVELLLLLLFATVRVTVDGRRDM